MSLAPSGSHRRRNPLTGRWVQVSPHRLDRPWQGEETAPEPAAPAYDPGCYLCPGNQRKNGVSNPGYTGVHVFDNDFPALTNEAQAGDEEGADDPFFAAETTRGVCRVMCFSPDHSRTLPDLDLAQIRAVIAAWAQETRALGERFAHVQVFENKGAMMGCSNPHPHCQIWASAHVPDEVALADFHQGRYLRERRSVLLADIAAREEVLGERVVELNADWLVIVPFWAAWPFETLLLPRFEIRRLPELAAAQRASLAAILKALTTRYDNLFRTSFPYSMGWHGAPFTGESAQHWRLHAHFYPPLLRSASVRKFMVGYEMLAEPQRDLTPESAAEMLRSAPGDVTYRASEGAQT